MAPKLLHESPTAPLARSGALWSATLITPGRGTSGVYGEQMLAEHAATAFPKGTKNWFMHPESDGQQRDPRDQWGVLAEDATYVPGVGVTAKIQVLPHWQTVVESLGGAGQANLSIWAMGESDTKGNVTALMPDVQNSVDLVGYPGREGSSLTSKMLESARAFGVTPPTEASADNPKAGSMDIDKLVEAVAANTAAVTGLLTAQNKAAEAAVASEAKADDTDTAVSKALTEYKAKIVAINAAGIAPEQKAELIERAEKGDDIAPLIESAKVLLASLTKHLTENARPTAGFKSEGAILGSGAAKSFGVTTWTVG
jgi:hypothetical protein